MRPLLLALLVPLLATAARAAAAPAGEAPAELLAALNRQRAVAGAPPLALHPALSAVAQRGAEELGAGTALSSEPAPLATVKARLLAAGYEPHGWSETYVATFGGPAAALGYLQGRGADSLRPLLDPDYRDLGVGVAELDGTPLYLLLAAWPEGDWFARRAAPLADLAAVRAAMLAAVNAARAVAGGAPLALSPRLEAAAQLHAADMLARDYYAHETPEGLRPRDRVLAEGYTARLVAENIAEGPLSVEAAMEGWLASPAHRRNLLLRGVTELGIGLAVGRDRKGYTAIWVQDLARPAD